MAPIRLTNDDFNNLVSQISPLISHHGPAVGLIALMEVCRRENRMEEAAIIQAACADIGVSFQLQRVESTSNPSKSYKVTRKPDGEMVCECMGWRYCEVFEKDDKGNYRTDAAGNKIRILDRITGRAKLKTCSHTRMAESRPGQWRDVVSLPTESLAQIRAAESRPARSRGKKARPEAAVQDRLVPTFAIRAIVLDDDD